MLQSPTEARAGREPNPKIGMVDLLVLLNAIRLHCGCPPPDPSIKITTGNWRTLACAHAKVWIEEPALMRRFLFVRHTRGLFIEREGLGLRQDEVETLPLAVMGHLPGEDPDGGAQVAC